MKKPTVHPRSRALARRRALVRALIEKTGWTEPAAPDEAPGRVIAFAAQAAREPASRPAPRPLGIVIPFPRPATRAS